MGSCKIIVQNNDVLQRLCGTNDNNLKLIESFLGETVFACGNELSIDSSSPDKAQQFNFIINRMMDEIADGAVPESDGVILKSIIGASGDGSFLDSGNIPDKALFDMCSIVIPGGTRKVYPRTRGQAEFVGMMRKSDLVFATGPAGCGKTFLAVCEALRLVLNHEKNGIILTRPVVEAGESLGYLPGNLEDKINPYMRPLYDAMNAVLPRDLVRKMIESDVVEIAPLAYMRGRTLNDSVIILDEAQNTTREQMKMFLTRMGEGSKVFVTGDVTQIDLPGRTQSGLVHALSVLENVHGISVKRLGAQDVVRSGLVKRIIQAYDDER
ncbi:MAG: PhoH family protein [Treponema sp.]|nr:PhoH family protein [Treponema sp.]MBQ2551579.1 PhoH family protein [Treponema sp.]